MKKQEHYYILVITKNGPVFATGQEGRNYMRWEKDKKPLEFDKTYAEEVHTGLTLNGYLNFVIVSKWEIDQQPYYYEHGTFYWKRKPKKKE